jgi:hypothetical protein
MLSDGSPSRLRGQRRPATRRSSAKNADATHRPGRWAAPQIRKIGSARRAPHPDCYAIRPLAASGAKRSTNSNRAQASGRGLFDGSSASAEGDHRRPADANYAGGPGGQVDAPSLHERATIIYPDGDASPGRMGSDCDVRAEWSGTMRRGHRAWIHPLARCGSATAVAVARSDASFGECRCR